MDKKHFWQIIEQSKQNKNSIDMNLQSDAILESLKSLEVRDLLEFQSILDKYQNEINTAHLEAVASTILDVSFPTEHVKEGFINWIICLGEQDYNKAKEAPTYLFKIKNERQMVSGRAYMPELNQVASAAFYDIDEDADWGVEYFRYKNLKRLKELSMKSKDPSNNLER